jgi:hypothetical protein
MNTEHFHLHNKLVVTSSILTPVELHKGVSIVRHDMETSQEEADTILEQQVAFVQSEIAIVVANDTYFFALLVPYY